MLSDLISKVAAEAGYAVSRTIIGSTDVTTKQLLAMANRIINEMAEKYDWTRLRKTASFTLVEDQDTYALPGDFSYYHYETFWNQTDRWRLYGPLSPQEYGERIGYGLENTIFDEFTIRGVTDKEITIAPTPTAAKAGQVIVYQYTSARPVRPRTWEANLDVAADSYIFWNGNYYTAAIAFNTGSTPPTHTSGTTGNWTYYSGKYESFLADTDVAVLSERILEQGIMERFGVTKKIDVMPLFETQLEDENGKNVNGKVLYAGGQTLSRFQEARSSRVVIGSRIYR